MNFLFAKTYPFFLSRFLKVQTFTNNTILWSFVVEARTSTIFPVEGEITAINKFEDTNGHRKKDKQWSIKLFTGHLRVSHSNPTKNKGELRCYRKVNSSCHVTLKQSDDKSWIRKSRDCGYDRRNIFMIICSTDIPLTWHGGDRKPFEVVFLLAATLY